MPHDPNPYAPTHEEHTGHGAHHVASRSMLLRTIAALCVLTVLTVGLAFAERAHIIPLGPLSVPVALLIAGIKATLVAMFFMGLKYDVRTNALAFVGGVVFLIIFMSFTFLDTLFRDTFEPASAVPVDIQEARSAEVMARDSLFQSTTNPASLVAAPDTLLMPGVTVGETPAEAAPVDAP